MLTDVITTGTLPYSGSNNNFASLSDFLFQFILDRLSAIYVDFDSIPIIEP